MGRNGWPSTRARSDSLSMAVVLQVHGFVMTLSDLHMFACKGALISWASGHMQTHSGSPSPSQFPLFISPSQSLYSLLSKLRLQLYWKQTLLQRALFCRELNSLVYITQAKQGVNLEHVHGSLMLFLYYWLILNTFLCCHVQQPGSTCQYPLKKETSF